jgi:short-subunit dehydrogenase
VAISSLASYRGLPKMAGYCASKSGVNNLMDGLRVELRSRGIVVTTICPGWIRTPLTANINVPHVDLMEVSDAARRIIEAIRAGKEFYAFPPAVAWRLRVLRLLPCPVGDWLATRAMRQLAKRGTSHG